MPTGIQLSSGVVVGSPKPLDAKFGPYNSTTDALNDIGVGLRYRGLTVGVYVSGVLKEYWFKDGTANGDFVAKSSDVTWDSLLNKPSTFPPSTHGHAITDVTGLQTALDGKQSSGSYATLENGKVPTSQLPSYVDDVLEYANLAAIQAVTGESGKIYVAMDTNKIYRWSGTVYVEISSGTTDWSALQNKPSSFPPSSHTHPISEVTGLGSAATVEANQNLRTTDTVKFAKIGDYTANVFRGALEIEGTSPGMAETLKATTRTNLGVPSVSDLDAKANTIGNVTFYNGTVTFAGGAKVNTNLDLSAGAAINVTGNGSQITFTPDTAAQTRTNLGAAAAVHTHPLSALTQSGASLQQVAQWDGTQWSPATVPAAGSLPVSELFTTSGTWTKPAGARLVEIICVGGGGAGGNGGQLGATPFLITSSDPIGFTITTQEPHGFANGNVVRFRGLTGSPARGDMETSPFYVLNASTNSFSISAVSGGPGVNPGSLTGGVVYRIVSAMSGGGGGGGGGICRVLLPASLLNDTEPVIVGAGGTRTNSAGASLVGSFATRIIARATQGGNGLHGVTATPASGGGAGLHGGNLGPNSSVTGEAGNGFFSWQTGLSGGAGGGISVTGVGFNGGYGAPSVANSSSLPIRGIASSSNSNNATSGADGHAPTSHQLIFGGSSGSGGGAQTHLDITPSNSLMSGTGGDGGDAKPDINIPGNYGCGGGGGGAGIANRGGLGGSGSAGAVLITTF